jgi:hypothetical protein
VESDAIAGLRSEKPALYAKHERREYVTSFLFQWLSWRCRSTSSVAAVISVVRLAESKAMNDSTDQSQNIQSGRDLNITATNSVVTLRELSGTVTNTIQLLPNTDQTNHLRELLTQLQSAITADTTLNDDDKAEALEQVKVLAEAGQNPQDGALNKAAKTATWALKGAIAAFPSATAFVKAITDLLPVVTKFFGF